MTVNEVYNEVVGKNIDRSGSHGVMPFELLSDGSVSGKALAGDELPLLRLGSSGDNLGLWYGWSKISVTADITTLCLRTISEFKFIYYQLTVDSASQDLQITAWMTYGGDGVAKEEKRKDICPRCGCEGEWAAMALRCRRGHGVFLGG